MIKCRDVAGLADHDRSAAAALTTGATFPDACGYAVGTAGDVNGDGFDDPLVGATGFDHTDWDMGATLVFSGVEILGTNYCGPAVANSSGASAVISAARSPSRTG